MEQSAGVHPFPQRDAYSERFIQALDALDLTAVRRVPKSDLHNHGTLGMRCASLRRISRAVPPPPAAFAGLRVTIVTDDLVAFSASVGEQFKALRRRGVFNSGELDHIRREGLAS